ncbi:hypothetical protein QKU48_gp0210 [Fadolivirus algeromassiliense]|jgi:hypothetical protein|uniref:Uncharacterized protein n=1 Tax=Fadolivirus FV1/VV64 TaxID=3070911 RepID=A0A7D3UNY0_9VIRU|nr:hypothetical protein QKU48_gp0210 [Fadolivirus algeromassiliense]QKF93668.1 hypothetical protein Fadolivirus_1_210 [Fadolivirus FV1/VV64]
MVCFIKHEKIKHTKKILPIRKSKIDHPHYNSKKYEKTLRRRMLMLLHNIYISKTSNDMIYHEKYNSITISDKSILHRIWNYNIIYDFVIIKIETHYNDGNTHISIMIINNINKIIEWFDTAPLNKDEKNIVTNTVNKYLPYYNIKIVNKKYYIQESDYDIYCQTWIYYFTYKRLYKNKDSIKIFTSLMKHNKEKRVDIIRNFFYKFN